MGGKGVRGEVAVEVNVQRSVPGSPGVVDEAGEEPRLPAPRFTHEGGRHGAALAGPTESLLKLPGFLGPKLRNSLADDSAGAAGRCALALLDVVRSRHWTDGFAAAVRYDYALDGATSICVRRRPARSGIGTRCPSEGHRPARPTRALGGRVPTVCLGRDGVASLRFVMRCSRLADRVLNSQRYSIKIL